MEFSGFSRDTLFTPVPNPLFGLLLEEIRDLAELKVTLRGLWLFHQKRGTPQLLSLEEFLNDPVLWRALNGSGEAAREAIQRGLRLAVARRTFLVHQPDADRPQKQVYLLNTERGRLTLARLRSDGVLPAQGEAVLEELDSPSPEAKPNIYALYEDNLGTISPLLAEELKEAEARYPWPWIREAFKIAVGENKRSWRYIAGILRRWAAEGKDAGHGKLGRYPEKDDPTKYVKEYQRRRGHLPWGRAGQ